MPSLPELQRSFAHALDGRAVARAPGFDVYRRAIDANYRRALGATFPVVRALVGRIFFDAAVDAFAAAHPPTSGDLNEYGGELGEFLARYEPASTLPYLPDVARLEWALDESARAADVETDARALIATISLVEDDAIPRLRLALHPSCRLLASHFTIFDIWSAHQQGHDAAMQVDPSGGIAEHILTRRSGEAPLVERVAGAEFAWLRALAGGADFGTALAQAMEIDSDFDLGEALQWRVADGTIGGVTGA
jgi:hypothetical protein